MVQIQAFTIADLRKRLESGAWFEGNPIPLSRERAQSQISNPRADETDVALLVAYDGERVIAHLGLVPDYVYAGDQQYKVGWLTAWWANPAAKYRGTGMMLMMRAFSFYKGGLGASGFSADAQAVYNATKRYKTIRESNGLSAFARMDLTELLPKRAPVLAKVRPLLRCVDATANSFVSVRQSLWRKNNPIPSEFRLEYVPELDAEAGKFLERHRQNEFSRRGARELNWIARYSWMACTPLTSPVPFWFEARTRSRETYFLKVWGDRRQLVAVLFLHIVDGHLIVPCCCHDEQAALVAKIIGHHLVEMRLKRLTIFRAELIEQFERSHFPWVVQKQRTRSWILSAPAAEIAATPVAVQDGDGDCAFTV